MMSVVSEQKLQIAMYPWVAMGHITPFIHLANDLAARGHSISILLPSNPLHHLSNIALHPDLIIFHVITIPHVDGLPLGTQTASDIDITEKNPFAVAFDATAAQVESLLLSLKPDVVFYDLAHWIPAMADKLAFKTVCYNVICASCMAFRIVPARDIPREGIMTEAELARPPPGYPSATAVLRGQEALTMSFICMDYGANCFANRVTAALSRCDAIGIRTCRELEGPMCDYLWEQYEKPVILCGPVLLSTAQGKLYIYLK